MYWTFRNSDGNQVQNVEFISIFSQIQFECLKLKLQIKIETRTNQIYYRATNHAVPLLLLLWYAYKLNRIA